MALADPRASAVLVMGATFASDGTGDLNKAAATRPPQEKESPLQIHASAFTEGCSARKVSC